jgi:hypothetical protein
MPTVEALARLTAILGRLAPLAQAQPGQPIEAARWNTLVEGVLELVRAVLEQDSGETTVPPHAHLEEVRLNWLQADLRQAFERGGLSDPSGGGKSQETDAALRRAATRLDALEAQTATVRERMVALATNDAVRGDEVIRLRRASEAGGAGTADQITGLRRSLDSLSVDAKQAAVAAQALSVDGQPVEIAKLLGRVGDLEVLRDGLRMTDNQLVSAAQIERRFAELEARTVTNDELDAALKDRASTLSDADRQGLRDGVRADVRGDLTADLSALETRLRNDTATQVAGFDALVGRRLAEATPALRDSILADASAAQAAAGDTLRRDVTASTTARIDALSTLLDARLDARQAALDARVATEAAAAVDRGLAPRLATVQAAIDALGARIGGSEAGLAEANRLLVQANDRVAAVERDAQTQLGALRDQMLRGLNDLQRSVSRDIAQVRADTSQQIAAAETRTTTTLRSEISSSEQRTNANINSRVLASNTTTVSSPAVGRIGATRVTPTP